MAEIALPTKGIQDQIDSRVLDILNKVNQKNTSKTIKRIVFKANGTLQIPSGVNVVYVTGCGGGGAGGVGGKDAFYIGGNGKATSIGNLLTLAGGEGGGGSALPSTSNLSIFGGQGGGNSGQSGESVFKLGNSLMDHLSSVGDGGNCGPFFGGRKFVNYTSPKAVRNGNTGCGGAGALNNSANDGIAAGGGGGEWVQDMPVSVTPLTNYAVTIGSGGIATSPAGNGGDGYLQIYWWE